MHEDDSNPQSTEGETKKKRPKQARTQVPPIHKKLTSMELAIQIIGWSVAILAIVGSVFSVIPGHRDMVIWLGCAAVCLVVIGAFCWIQDRAWKSDAVQVRSDTLMADLPGFGFFAVVKLSDSREDRRKYLFDFGSKTKERLSIYVSPDGIFTLSLVDARGEPHPLQVPLGPEGFPLNRRIHFGFEVGVTSSTTYLRLTIDGVERGLLSLPFKIDIGSLHIEDGNVGADLDGSNGAQFEVYFSLETSTILSAAQRASLLAATEKFIKATSDTMPPLSLGEKYVRFRDLIPLKSSRPMPAANKEQ